MDFGLSSLLTGGLGLLGNMFSSSQSAKNMREQNEFNAQQAQIAREWQESMWNKQNEYNTPTNQLARIREAGLSPGLMYGQGGSFSQASVPSASTARAAETQRVYFDPTSAIQLALQSMQTKQSIKTQKAQEEQIKAQTIGQEIQNDINSATLDEQVEIKRLQKRASELTNEILNSQDYQEKVKSHKLDVELETAKVNYDYLIKEKDLSIQESQARIRQINRTTDAQVNLMSAQQVYYATGARLNQLDAALKSVELKLANSTYKAEVVSTFAKMKSNIETARNLVKQGKLLDAKKVLTDNNAFAAMQAAKLNRKKADNYTTEQILKFAMPIIKMTDDAVLNQELKEEYIEDYGSQTPPPTIYY